MIEALDYGIEKMKNTSESNVELEATLGGPSVSIPSLDEDSIDIFYDTVQNLMVTTTIVWGTHDNIQDGDKNDHYNALSNLFCCFGHLTQTLLKGRSFFKKIQYHQPYESLR